MTTEIVLPRKVRAAHQEVLEFILKSSMMRDPPLFALRLQKKSIGEEAIRIALTLASDPPIIFLPPTGLRSHDIETLKGAIRAEAERFSKGSIFDKNATLSETLRQASSLTKDRKLAVWLDLTEVPLGIWPYWRIPIEQGICAIAFVCTKSQWAKAEEEIPEFVGCVFQKTMLNGFLTRDDLSQLKKIVHVYVTVELADSVIDQISKDLSKEDLELVSEVDFQRLIWNAMKGGS